MTHSIYDPGVFGQACLKQPPDSALSSHSWTRQLHRAACFHPPVYPVIAAVLLGHDTRHVKSELHIMIHNANLKKYEHWIQPEWNDAMQVSESVQITNYLYNPISWSIPIRHEYFKSFVCKHNQKRIRLYIIRGEYGSATSMHHLLSYCTFRNQSLVSCACNVTSFLLQTYITVCTNYIAMGGLTPKGSGLTFDMITMTSLRLDLVGLMSKDVHINLAWILSL